LVFNKKKFNVTKVAIVCLKTHFKTKNKKFPSFFQISKIEKIILLPIPKFGQALNGNDGRSIP
jgi:hypothetical protein